jgi:hypothetical protein
MAPRLGPFNSQNTQESVEIGLKDSKLKQAALLESINKEKQDHELLKKQFLLKQHEQELMQQKAKAELEEQLAIQREQQRKMQEEGESKLKLMQD